MRRSRSKGIIRGRRCPMIQLCPRCGQMRVHHSRRIWECDKVTEDVFAAVQRWARTHGKRWKSLLLAAWDAGCEGEKDRDLLLLAKQQIGKYRLYKIKVDA